MNFKSEIFKIVEINKLAIQLRLFYNLTKKGPGKLKYIKKSIWYFEIYKFIINEKIMSFKKKIINETLYLNIGKTNKI